MNELKPEYPVFEEKGEGNEYVRGIIYDVMDAGTEPVDNLGRKYDYVGKYLQSTDFYQGLDMITVIRSRDTGVLYGYSWWDGQGHYEDSVEPNGDEYGLECDTDTEGFDWDTDYVSYYVWLPVAEISIKGYDYID